MKASRYRQTAVQFCQWMQEAGGKLAAAVKPGFRYRMDNQSMSRLIGIGLACSVMLTAAIASRISDVRQSSRQFTVYTGVNTHSTRAAGNVVIPFDDVPETEISGDSAETLYRVYQRIVEDEENRKKEKQAQETAQEQTADFRQTREGLPTLSPSDLSVVPVPTHTGDALPGTDSTLPVTQSTATTASSTVTTVSTTVTTSATETTTTAVTLPTESLTTSEPAGDDMVVSNGREPFRYEDVSSIAPHLTTLGEFVAKLNPGSYSWNTEDYAKKGVITVVLKAEGGSVTLDVRPLVAETAPYTIDGETSGSGSDAIRQWDWFLDNKGAGCNIASVIWTGGAFGIKPVRGVAVGCSLSDVTDSFLCINGGASTLYKASDVITDQNKLNTLLSAESAYHFVGGRFYTMDSYLKKFYAKNPHACPFAQCDYVVQYGCNSIMEHSYATGSWILEYAIQDDVVQSIRFMNKSYSKTESRTAVSKETSKSESTAVIIAPGEGTEKTTTTVPSAVVSEPEIREPVGSEENLNPTTEASHDVASSDGEAAPTTAGTVREPSVEESTQSQSSESAASSEKSAVKSENTEKQPSEASDAQEPDSLSTTAAWEGGDET